MTPRSFELPVPIVELQEVSPILCQFIYKLKYYKLPEVFVCECYTITPVTCTYITYSKQEQTKQKVSYTPLNMTPLQIIEEDDEDTREDGQKSHNRRNDRREWTLQKNQKHLKIRNLMTESNRRRGPNPELFQVDDDVQSKVSLEPPSALYKQVDEYLAIKQA
jgi:hypothetical protein